LKWIFKNLSGIIFKKIIKWKKKRITNRQNIKREGASHGQNHLVVKMVGGHVHKPLASKSTHMPACFAAPYPILILIIHSSTSTRFFFWVKKLSTRGSTVTRISPRTLSNSSLFLLLANSARGMECCYPILYRIDTLDMGSAVSLPPRQVSVI